MIRHWRWDLPLSAMAVLLLLAVGVVAFADDSKAPESVVPEEMPEGYFQIITSHPAMYTQFEFTIIAEESKFSREDMQGAAQEAFAAIDRLEDLISTWRRGTQASRINSEGAQHSVGVAPTVLNLVESCVRYWRDTDKAFDITVGPLVELWRTCKMEKRLPTEEELTAARAVVGSDKLVVVPDDHSVGFATLGMRLDFGGIAKGWALDRAHQVLEEYGVSCALLDAGTSSMLAIGAPPGKPGWTVQLRHPYNKELLEEAIIRDEALSTSGYALDFFEVNGKKYGHIIDPRTGMPTQGTLYAMAIGSSGSQTEALSKGFFINGIDWAQRYCEQHPDTRGLIVPDPGPGESPKPVRINMAK
ncbi:MAG: FAD:protein FMN transferase [Candidatus Hydrogenedentes bacterium]|nr:FAD:protein FMN transferase [Candidatus Hydrogenedentota bacterium]